MMSIPRRCYIEKWTPAERAIKDAIAAIEAREPHPDLTDVQIVLASAFEKLADYEDARAPS